MKLTKQRLKEIIKEEFSDAILLSEGVWEEWFEIEKEYPHLWQSAASAIAFAIEKVPGQKSIKRAKYGKYSPKWAQAKVGQVPTPLSAEWDQLSISVKRAATGALKKWLKERAPHELHGIAQSKKAAEDPGWYQEEDFFSRGGTRDPEQRPPVRESNTKLTKQKLKEIIKEELSKLNEVLQDAGGVWVIERTGVSSDERYLHSDHEWRSLWDSEIEDIIGALVFGDEDEAKLYLVNNAISTDSLPYPSFYSDDELERMEIQAPESEPEEPALHLGAPTAASIEKLKQGLRRQKSPRSPGDFRHWRDRWEK